ncbi:hypothetical protein O0I10_006240 [Lichtheimia ornata]|uniref:Uncharacterized protein n=1 Tax=Lichtheimia ornata TaxID=688661 RepID=A0AAD7V269_9FUNG|nr:uncharacterized protein O0I10_006240 [Lichtheimia ornata]KAJ8657969.1 hypothetical protein O0I10_006240 [Lichtheimia ornata]
MRVQDQTLLYTDTKATIDDMLPNVGQWEVLNLHHERLPANKGYDYQGMRASCTLLIHLHEDGELVPIFEPLTTFDAYMRPAIDVPYQEPLYVTGGCCLLISSFACPQPLVPFLPLFVSMVLSFNHLSLFNEPFSKLDAAYPIIPLLPTVAITSPMITPILDATAFVSPLLPTTTTHMPSREASM